MSAPYTQHQDYGCDRERASPAIILYICTLYQKKIPGVSHADATRSAQKVHDRGQGTPPAHASAGDASGLAAGRGCRTRRRQPQSSPWSARLAKERLECSRPYGRQRLHSCGRNHTSIQSGYILSLSPESSREGAIALCHTYNAVLSLGSSCS